MKLKHFCLIATVLAGVVSAAPAASFAQGEHARRAGAELLVITSDARKLIAPSLTVKHKAGLMARINGGLAGLALMMRLADQEISRPREGATATIHQLRTLLQEGDLKAFLAAALKLTARYPFRATGILPAELTPGRLKRAKETHEEHCAGCHDEPDLDVKRPAFNLFRQAKSMPPLEFAARMIIGIRGDRQTGIDNPFPDEELAALLVFYSKTEQESE